MDDKIEMDVDAGNHSDYQEQTNALILGRIADSLEALVEILRTSTYVVYASRETDEWPKYASGESQDKYPAGGYAHLEEKPLGPEDRPPWRMPGE